MLTFFCFTKNETATFERQLLINLTNFMYPLLQKAGLYEQNVKSKLDMVLQKSNEYLITRTRGVEYQQWMLKMNYQNLPTTDEAILKKNQKNDELREETLNEEKGIEKPITSMLSPHFIETKELISPNKTKQNLELKLDDDMIPSYYENLTVYSYLLYAYLNSPRLIHL